MIAMWDDLFISLDGKIKTALDRNRGLDAYGLMHNCLENVWKECFRVLRPGAYLCLNIGDATRSLGGSFRLYPNHSTISTKLLALGFNELPCIIWRKTTNAPNKFMGSGMLPAGAYVTLEHEYILIFRKAGKRLFAEEAEKQKRRRSACFWSDRNVWFSDLWEFTGARQNLSESNGRSRSAVFPLLLPYRLIQMYSLYDDTVLDPFWGTGTTGLAALISGRNSIGYEIDDTISAAGLTQFARGPQLATEIIENRIIRHNDALEKRKQNGKTVLYQNPVLGLEVITAQEKQIELFIPSTVKINTGEVTAEYIKYLPDRK
ncbi:MAG: site-specific DNA-methyltransferase [Spirochaetales bacterium]|nr:site-specific DNA-methyltransferase [Spirochaetales bacterium]